MRAGWLAIGCLFAAHSAIAEEPDTELVRKYFEEGQVHYNLADYENAIRIFKEGYAATRAPGFLFNIAQAYRLSGDCASALTFYRNYVRTKPDAPNRDRIDARIDEMQACADRALAKVRVVETTTTAAPATESVRAAPELVVEPPIEEGGTSVVGTVLIVGGLAALGGGIYFHLGAADASKDVSNLSSRGGEWGVAEEDVEARGKRMSALAIISYLISGAAIAAGAVLHATEADGT